MKKRLIISTMMCLAGASAFAGGLVTNTNQNPIFFRQPAQNAVVGIQGTYYNPAGLALMSEGFHFAIGDQMAIQSREITSTYAPFAGNVNHLGEGTVKFEGKTFSPVIPTLDLSYNQNSWAASFHFGVVSGGGSCAFDKGLGSFEAPMALLPQALNALAGPGTVTGYDADIHFTGKSFGFAGQFNFSYKLIDDGSQKLGLAAGLRLNYLMNDYSGGIFDYKLNYGGAMVPAATVLTGALTGMGLPAEQAGAYAQQLGADKEIACIQKGFALNPILSAHYSIGALDIAARYEFNTKVTLKNSTDKNTAGLAQFNDGVESRSDIPALLAVGLSYEILPTLRAAAGYNLFFDKKADFGGKQDLLGANTYEGMFGIEWDACEKATLSVGTQLTKCDFGENNAYLSDMAFGLSSWCLGGGGRFFINDRMAIDLSAFYTFYEGAEKQYADYGNAGATFAPVLGGLGVPSATLDALKIPGKDEFMRSSLSFGLGLVYNF